MKINNKIFLINNMLLINFNYIKNRNHNIICNKNNYYIKNKINIKIFL